ncbi:3-deoxy-manno-octulosonate cytidylyltransferase [Deltaproteobacteria bacterium]|nr:3-deoxy-manno-octulosonate cytidylyltransferase [Deltaproteobacteria bacterium]
MFWHVWNRARQSARIAGVTLCTDDERIASEAAKWQVPCVMTRADHPNGSSRVYEAAAQSGIPEDAVVVNIQGDEPALAPAMLDTLLLPFNEEETLASTLACPISREEALLPDRVKVVCDRQGNALYFSRAPIPFEQKANPRQTSPYLLHVGIYAYRLRVLADYTRLAPSPLEELESLEQLRLLENRIPMRVMTTTHRSHGVDRKEDIGHILPLMQESGRL